MGWAPAPCPTFFDIPLVEQTHILSEEQQRQDQEAIGAAAQNHNECLLVPHRPLASSLLGPWGWMSQKLQLSQPA